MGVVVIPARLESSRLARKLLRPDSNGIPIICRTAAVGAAACAMAPEVLREVIVATDAKEIAEAVGRHREATGIPIRAEMTRTDHSSGSDRIAEVVGGLDRSVDVVVNLQGDEPGMPAEYVVRCARALRQGAGLDMATLAWPICRREDLVNPDQVKVVCRHGAEGGPALYFSRSPIPFDRDQALGEGEVLGLGHLGIYAYRRVSLLRFTALAPGWLEVLERLEQLRALEQGMSIWVEVVERPVLGGIDTQGDYDDFLSAGTDTG